MKSGSAFILLIATIFLSCHSGPEKKHPVRLPLIPNDEAVCFNMHAAGHDYYLEVVDPITSEVLQTVSTLPDTAAIEHYLRLKSVPERIVVLSTTHLGFIEMLGATDQVIGVANAKLVHSDKIRSEIESGRIQDVGNDQTLNFEKLVSLEPDFVLMYDFGSGTAAVISRLEKLGMPVVLVQEFMERTPLGKLEWIRFFGALLDKRRLADESYENIAGNYHRIQKLIQDSIQFRPTVFTGLPWKGEWYQPGGASFQAAYLKDAGAAYLWEDNPDISGIIIDREVIYDKAIDADFWLHTSNAISLAEILGQDSRHAEFRSFKEGRVYNNNAQMDPSLGNNNYWEAGIVHPDSVLLDLATIFHPELFPDRKLYFYQQLK